MILYVYLIWIYDDLWSFEAPVSPCQVESRALHHLPDGSLATGRLPYQTLKEGNLRLAPCECWDPPCPQRSLQVHIEAFLLPAAKQTRGRQ